jgi:N-acetylneuraminic acid mutarotase/pimeloyl-ACP methyl ester carboxylesterase
MDPGLPSCPPVIHSAAFGWGEVGTTDAYDTSANVWATKSPLAMSRWSLTSAALGGKLYAIGGTFGIQSYPLSSNEEYDPSTNTWNVRTDMPTPRWKLTSAVVGGRIYAIGGGPSGNQNLATAVVEVYDALSDSWQSETPMPSPRWGMGSAAISDRIFVVGGYLGFTYAYPSGFATGALEILDATSHTWASGPPMPTPRWDAAAVAADGKLYVIGGYDGSRVLSTVEVFDTATGLWDTSSRAPMPTPRTGLAAVVMDGRIYCFGGHDGTNVVSTLEIYDPATDTWTTPGGTSCTLSCSATAPTTATEGQELQFTATATQVGCTGVPTFNWDFGDGTASYQQNPLHSYVARVVPYEWTMIASLPGTPNCTQGGAIEVAPACAPPVITSQPKPDNPVEPGKSVTLTVEAAGAEHFKWYVGETGDIEAPGVNDASSYETPPVTTTTLYRVRVISGCGAFVEGGPYTVRELRVAVLLVHGIRGTAGSFSADDRLYPIGEPGSEAAGPCRPSQAGDYMCFAHNGWLPCSEADFPSPSSRPECLPIMGKLLHDAGFTVAQPFDYRDKTPDETNWSIERLAGELKKHINCVLKGDCIYPRGTRVDAVDIVAHSMGGLITRAYLAGLATDRDAGDAGVSYGGEIRKVVTAGTPHYGGDFARLQTYVPTSLFPFPVPSNSSQGYQMDYGSDFIWKLDQKWRELVTPPIGPDDYMTVVGLAGGQQANDGVVYAASAVLPQGPQEIPHGEFPEGEHVRYVDACHIPGLQLPWPLPDLCPPNTPGLVAAADELHATYQIVRDFLRGEEPAAFLGEPSVAAYGLLLAKLFEESPRAPAELGSGERNLSVAVDGKKADYKLSRDYLFSLSCVFQRNCGNGITIFPISPGEHTITIRASGYRPITQQSEVAWGRPTAIEIEAVPAADLEVVRAALFCRAPTWPVVRVRNVGRLASDTVDLSFFGSDDDKYSGDDVPLATYTLESLSPGKVGGRLYSVPKTTRKYVLAFVNSRGTVPEASRDNNVGVMESCEVAHILRKARATDSQFGRHSANRTVKSGATPGSAFRPLTPAPEQ